MDGQEEKPSGEVPIEKPVASIGSVGLSRRDFTKRVAGGSAAAMGVAWAAPKITTIRYAAKAKAGSPPPTSTTTTTSVPIGQLGHIALSVNSPCVGDTIRVAADGFAPGTAVTLEIDSAAHTLGVTTASGTGSINVDVLLPTSGPTGAHTLKAVGVQTGGRTLTLSAPITIKTEAECAVGSNGTTSTTAPGTVTTTPGSTTPVTIGGKQGGGGPLGSGSLAFTGTDAIDLALVGGAAALGGRMLYGLARRSDDDEDEE